MNISHQSIQQDFKNFLGYHSYRLYCKQHLSNDAKLKNLTECSKFSRSTAWKMFYGGVGNILPLKMFTVIRMICN